MKNIGGLGWQALHKALVAALLSLHGAQAAQEPLRVHAVSPPVWLQRGEASTPLQAGTHLRSSDLVTVGATGSAVIRVDEVRIALQANSAWLFPEDSGLDKTAQLNRQTRESNSAKRSCYNSIGGRQRRRIAK